MITRIYRSVAIALMGAIVLTGIVLSGDETSNLHVAPGWKALLANDFDAAEQSFATQNPVSSLEALRILQGQYACAWVKEKYETCEKLRWEMVKKSAPMPDGFGVEFLTRFSERALSLGHTDQLVKSLQTLLAMEPTPDPDVALLARDILKNIYSSRRQYSKTETLIENDGWVRLFSRVIGPFRDKTGFLMHKEYPPERNPGRDAYDDGSGFPVQVISSVKGDRDGGLSLEETLPNTGMPSGAYVGVLIKSPDERDVVLSFPGRQGVRRVWLRGAPVYDDARYQHEYRTDTRKVRVRLLPGVNPLLLKVYSSSYVSLRILSPDGGIDPQITVTDDAQAGFAGWSLLPVAGVLMSREYPPRYLRCLEKMHRENENLPTLLWLAAAYEENGKYQEARSLYNELLAKSPESLYALLMTAGARQRESQQGIDSAMRLVKEAMDLYAQALKIDESNYLALYQTGLHAKTQNQTERSLRFLKKAVETAPNAFGARQALADVYSQRGWTDQAKLQYLAVAERCPTADGILASFYESTGRVDQAVEIREQMWNEGRYHYFSKKQDLIERYQWDEAQALLEEWYRHHPASHGGYRRQSMSIARHRGDMDRVRELLEEEFNANPEDSRALIELADLFLAAGRKEDAIRQLEKAIAVQDLNDSVDPELRRRVRVLKGEAWSLMDYDVPLQTVDTDAVKKHDFPEANHARLLHVVVRRIYTDYSSESLVHNAIKVFDKQGMGSLSEMSVPQNSDALLFCRTIQPDGSVFVPTSVENFQLNKATSMYGVTPGSVLEYAYRETREGNRANEYSDQYQVQQLQIPLTRGRYCLILPDEMVSRMSLDVTPDDLLPHVSAEDGLTRLQWDISDYPPLKLERNLPIGEVLATVKITIRSDEQRGSFLTGPHWSPVRTNEEIEKLSQDICDGVVDDNEIVDRIYAWIAQHIKDTGSAQTARDTLALRSGSSNAKSRLATAMLAAHGLEASDAVVNTFFGTNNGITRDDRRQLVGSFYSGNLLHVNLPEQPDRWLQFYRPSKHYRPSDLSPTMIGAPALIKNSHGSRFSWVWGDQTGRQGEDQISVSILEDGSADVSGTIAMFGPMAGRLRTVTEDPQRGPLVLEGIVGRIFPKIELDQIDETKLREDESIKDTGDPFVCRFQGHVRQYCRPEGKRFTFNPFVGTTGAEYFVAPLPRENDFELTLDHIKYDTMNYIAPEGWGFVELPSDISINAEGGFYQLDYTVRGRRLTVSRVLIVPAQRVTPRKYETLHRFLSDVEQTHRQIVTIARCPANEFGGYWSEIHYDSVTEPIQTNRYFTREWPEQLDVSGSIKADTQGDGK